jgi:hypothetical protein
MSTASLTSVASPSAIAVAAQVALAKPAYSIPGALQQFLEKVEGCAVENRRKFMRESLKFWSLKASAILAVAGSGVMAMVTGAGLPVTILTVVACICFVFDLVFQPGEHRKFYLRASQGLRRLKQDVESRWQIASFERRTSSTTLAEILEDGWKAKMKIAD